MKCAVEEVSDQSSDLHVPDFFPDWLVSLHCLGYGVYGVASDVEVHQGRSFIWWGSLV